MAEDAAASRLSGSEFTKMLVAAGIGTVLSFLVMTFDQGRKRGEIVASINAQIEGIVHRVDLHRAELNRGQSQLIQLQQSLDADRLAQAQALNRLAAEQSAKVAAIVDLREARFNTLVGGINDMNAALQVHGEQIRVQDEHIKELNAKLDRILWKENANPRRPIILKVASPSDYGLVWYLHGRG